MPNKGFPPHPPSHAGNVNPRRKWHAVSIISDGYRCDAVRMLGQQRFLAAEAPRLPLAQCSATRACQCKYKHHEDRRVATRRREDRLGLPQRYPPGNERRVTRSRRDEDGPLSER
jgi:hypothetical protein